MVSPDTWLLYRDTSQIIAPVGGKNAAPSTSIPLTSSPTKAASLPVGLSTPSILMVAFANVAENS